VHFLIRFSPLFPLFLVALQYHTPLRERRICALTIARLQLDLLGGGALPQKWGYSIEAIVEMAQVTRVSSCN